MSRSQALDDGKGVHYLSALTDLTERSRIEEALRRSEGRLRERTLQAEQRAVLLRSLASELMRAEQNERRRIAAVLHDSLQQLLVSARIKLGIARRQRMGDKARASLEDADELLGDTLKASRTLAISLSPPVLYEAGLIRALEWLARWFKEQHGLTVRLDMDPSAEPADGGVRIFMFDGLRELLLNVVKYAAVSHAELSLRRDAAGKLHVRVRDHGQGFDPQDLGRKKLSDHFGLVSLGERLRLLDSTLEIDSAPGKGTRIGFTLSIPPETPAVQAIQAPARGRKAGGRSGPAVPPPETHRRIRVLIVDDHAILREGAWRRCSRRSRTWWWWDRPPTGSRPWTSPASCSPTWS